MFSFTLKINEIMKIFFLKNNGDNLKGDVTNTGDVVKFYNTNT